MQQPKTGRQLILERLNEAIRMATTADLQRAAIFLEGAKQIRAGSKRQRAYSRQEQATSWKKKVDSSITW
jgi:hypothetical protein|tara:strand:- start:370 stop:579 length:210 start_codon:yes stop_codon:yes gene_type:complete